MKRKLIMVIAFIIIMTPFAVFGKTAISDMELDEVTAEDGVSIDLSVMTFKTIKTTATMSWGDGNGYGSTYTSAGFVGATDINTEDTVGSTFAKFSGSPTQIDVGSSATETRLTIQPQDITIGPLIVDETLKVGPAASLSAASGAKELGRINMQDYTAKITADRIQISAH